MGFRTRNGVTEPGGPFSLGGIETALREAQQRRAARAAAEARQNQIATGRQRIDSAFAPYSDSFFDTARDRYRDSYLADVQNDYFAKRDELQNAFSGSSGAGAFQFVNDFAGLDNEYAQKRAAADTEASNFASGLRADVTSARDGLYGENDTLANADAIGTKAGTTAGQFSNRGYSDLGNMFASFARAPVQAVPAAQGGGFTYGTLASPTSGGTGAALNVATPKSSSVVR